jgi:predicted alpha/beta hydrolase family esterase
MPQDRVIFVHGRGGSGTGIYADEILGASRWKGCVRERFDWRTGGRVNFNANVRNAVRAGGQLRRKLQELAQQNTRVNIVAHSLGVRVVHQALKAPCHTLTVGEVWLMAGAFPRHFSWWPVVQQIDGEIFNFASSRDMILKRLYLPYKRRGGAVGLPTRGDSEGDGPRFLDHLDD